MYLQDLVLALQRYWADQGCILGQGYDLEVGAGTMNPQTFLRVLGPEPWRVAYVEPSRRPVRRALRREPEPAAPAPPVPGDPEAVAARTSRSSTWGRSRAFGIDPLEHDIRFVEDDWESPTLGAWGLGWEVWCDGMEITQFTYFQQAGGIECRPVAAELTYGLERIAMYLQNIDNVYDMQWAKGVRYGELFHPSEVEFSKYSLNDSDPKMLFDAVRASTRRSASGSSRTRSCRCRPTTTASSARTPSTCSMRGGPSASPSGRATSAACARWRASCAKGYLEQRERLGFPLLPKPPEKEAAA